MTFLDFAAFVAAGGLGGLFYWSIRDSMPALARVVASLRKR